jgi:hypothetical protein
MILFDGCHLCTDEDNEINLHKIAKSVGLKQKWFQNDQFFKHYDVLSKTILNKLIDHPDVVLVTSKTIVKVIRKNQGFDKRASREELNYKFTSNLKLYEHKRGRIGRKTNTKSRSLSKNPRLVHSRKRTTQNQRD